MKVPGKLPRPPVMEVPPTTTAAIAFSSSPTPVLAGTSEKRIAFKKARQTTEKGKHEQGGLRGGKPGEACGLFI
jgi:hypothetical protein